MAQSGPQDSLDPWRKLRPLIKRRFPASLPTSTAGGLPLQKGSERLQLRASHPVPHPKGLHLHPGFAGASDQEVPRARRCHRNWVCYCSWSSTNSLHPCKTCSSKYSITTDTENRKENLKPQIASNTLVLSSFKLPNANYRYHCQLLARGLLYNQSISSLQPLHNWPWRTTLLAGNVFAKTKTWRNVFAQP